MDRIIRNVAAAIGVLMICVGIGWHDVPAAVAFLGFGILGAALFGMFHTRGK